MLAFRPFDTNNAVEQARLGLSPPSKTCTISPSKVPHDGNFLFNSASPEKTRDFKFDLTQVSCQAEKVSDCAKSTRDSNSDWQGDLNTQISSFERAFAERKSALLLKLKEMPTTEARSQLVESFLKTMEE